MFHQIMLITCRFTVVFGRGQEFSLPPAVLSPAMARAAGIAHVAFYVTLLVLPLSGLALVASGGDRIPLLGLDLPGFGPSGDLLRSSLWVVHVAFAIATSILVLVHIAAAVRHAMRRDGTFSRMLPGSRTR